MARKGKQQTPQGMAIFRDYDRRDRSLPVAESFPNVGRIEIKARYIPEASWMGKSQERNESYSPDQKAYFKLSCPWRDCIAGGLDLESEVRSIVDENTTNKSDRGCCSGTLNRAS